MTPITGFKLQIEALVNRGRNCYSDLTAQEKRDIVCAAMTETECNERYILVDADHHGELPGLLARVFWSGRTKDSVKEFLDKAEELLITGTATDEAYIAFYIDNMLEEEASYKKNPLGYLDDMRAQDAKERARDMQAELRK